MLMIPKAKLTLALVVLLGTLAACDSGQPQGTTNTSSATTTPATATTEPLLAATSTLPAGTGTGNPDSTATAVIPGKPTPSSSGSGSIVGQVIETKAFGGAPGVRITVEDVREATELNGGGKTAKAKGKFVLVLVKAESINTTGKNLGFSTTKLKDSKGNVYGLDNFDAQRAAAGETGRESSNYILAPGLSVTSVLVYEVPSGATGFVLVPSDV